MSESGSCHLTFSRSRGSARRRPAISLSAGSGPEPATKISSSPCLSTALPAYHRDMLSVTRRACLLLFLAWPALAQSTTWRGTWSATGPGVNLSGSWTARLHEDPNSGLGTWTLFDAAGRTAAAGSWSARKSEQAWQGRWSALLPNERRPISGTWTARARIDGSARFAELLRSALTQVVSGTWGRSGAQTGAWSIRASGTE